MSQGSLAFCTVKFKGNLFFSPLEQCLSNILFCCLPHSSDFNVLFDLIIRWTKLARNWQKYLHSVQRMSLNHWHRNLLIIFIYFWFTYLLQKNAFWILKWTVSSWLCKIPQKMRNNSEKLWKLIDSFFWLWKHSVPHRVKKSRNWEEFASLLNQKKIVGESQHVKQKKIETLKVYGKTTCMSRRGPKKRNFSLKRKNEFHAINVWEAYVSGLVRNILNYCS